MAPNILWIHLSETIASESLGRPRSRLISVLLIYTLIGIAVVFAAISFIQMEPQSVPGSPVAESALLLFAFSAFGTLIACAVLAARRIIDASEAPHVDRGLRIFGYTAGLIYIAIGMFFIGPKLKKIKAQAANTHSGSIP